jgi:hypothetical protein
MTPLQEDMGDGSPPLLQSRLMPRRNASHQAQALRVLADELEAGTRELSPEMTKALDHELTRDDDGDYEELTKAQWEEAWGTEIDRRLEEYRAGKATKHNVADVIAGLRARR